MRNRLPVALSAILAAAAMVGGCSCSDPETARRPPKAEVRPASLDFGAVCNEAPSQPEVFELWNEGGADLVATLAVAGDHEEFFDVQPRSITVPRAGKAEISVVYHPTGDVIGERHEAEVVISYEGADGTETETVALFGEVSTAPIEPRVALACAPGRNGEALPSCDENDAVPCCSVDPVQSDRLGPLGVGSTPLGQTSALPLRIENLGCGELNVTSIELAVEDREGFCTREEFTVPAGPFTLPGGLGAGQGQEIEVEFSPVETCSVLGTLTFHTDDPAAPTVTATISSGRGRAPQILVDPSFINFRDTVLPGQSDTAEFVIRNVGSDDITIRALDIENLGKNQLDYSILRSETVDCDGGARTEVDAAGHVLGPNDGKANCGVNELFVTVEYAPTTPADHDHAEVVIQTDDGTYTVVLRGGIEPKIEADPEEIFFLRASAEGANPGACEGDAGICDRSANDCFGMCLTNADCPGGETCYGATGGQYGTCLSAAACAPTCGLSSKTIEIWNRGKAPLEVGEPYLTSGRTDNPSPVPLRRDGSPMVRIGAETCSGKSLTQDTFCTVEVILDHESGHDAFQGNLWIPSNDPLHDERDFAVYIEATPKIDQQPDAEADYEDRVTARTWVRIDAGPSHDPDGNEVTSWSWKLTAAGGASGFNAYKNQVIDPLNPNALCPPTVNGGECFRFPIAGANKARVLEFWPDLPVVFEFELTVGEDVCGETNRETIQITATN